MQERPTILQVQTVVNQQRAERLRIWLEGQDPRIEEKRWLLVVYPVRS